MEITAEEHFKALITISEPEWSYDVNDWHWLDGGFAIPQRFTFTATSPTGWTADVDVEVSGGKARTRSLKVSTDAPEGVTAALVRKVKIRPIVARGALKALRRSRVAKDGSTKLAPFMLGEEEQAFAVLERVVGYVDLEGDFIYERQRLERQRRSGKRKR